MRNKSNHPWLPAALDADFSPRVAELLRTAHGRRELSSRLRRRDEVLRAAVRKHLRALGWTILSRPNAAMLTRICYRAPDGGKSYVSLPDLIIDSAAAAHLIDDDTADGGKMIIAINNESPPPPPGEQEEEEEEEDDNDDGDDEYDDDDGDDDGPAEPAAAHEHVGIDEYIALMATNDRARGRRAERVRDSAKRHLLAAGWTFWMKLKSNGREELRYKAPTGRSYTSLHTACQAFVKATHCRPLPLVTTTSKKRKRLSQLTGGGDVTMKKCTTIKKRKKEVVGADGTHQLIKKSITTTTLTRKKKRRRTEATTDSKSHSQARVLRPNSTCQRRSRTLLSVLIDRGIVVPRDKVVTCRDWPAAAKDGLITGEGIRCTCCNRAFTVAEFEAHATGRLEVEACWARVFLKKDGRSLSQCLVELMRRDVGVGVAPDRKGGVRVKEKCIDEEGDSVCAICNDGGELLLCDNCPSTFHHACVGLQDTPEGDWFCPSCRCGVCGGSDFDHQDTAAAAGFFFTDRTIIYCEQCEREYHVGCVRRPEEEETEWRRRRQEDGRPWLCSRECGEVFQGLAAAARARSIPTRVKGVSLTILRRRPTPTGGCQQESAAAAEHGQLCAALDVLHECFVPLVEPRTQTDLAADIVFNRESDLRRLNFRGYYVVGLEKSGELITVGTLRVFGADVAELPLVGTRFAHRRQGMCHLLVTELEKMLRQLGVRTLVLPAVPELLPMWTASLGFRPMTHSDMTEIAADHAILSFQGTTMCQKDLLPAH